MALLSYIIWSPNPDIFSIGGLTVRWYGLLFALGFIISQQIMFYIYRKENKPEKDVETLTIYMVIATIIGARLGHVLFYEPDVYLSDPIKILKIWEGGLASHGAAIGILLAIYFYAKKTGGGQTFLWVVDRIVIVVALTGCLIRLGNFMNSEIVGIPTESNFGVVFGWDLEQRLEAYDAIEDVYFEKTSNNGNDTTQSVPLNIIVQFQKGTYQEENVRNFLESEVAYLINNYKYATMHFASVNQLQYQLDQRRGAYIASLQVGGISRHPAQLYESISSLLIFIVLFWWWKKNKATLPDGQLFGMFLVILFGLRFVYEFLKVNQVDFEDTLPLNMGQWLSIPMVLAGVLILIYSNRKKISR